MGVDGKRPNRVRKQEMRDKNKGQIIKGLLFKLRSLILMGNRKFYTVSHELIFGGM